MRSTLLPLAAIAALAAVPGQAEAPSSLTVGTVTLDLCQEESGGYCGSIERALDPSGAVAGTIPIGFEWYPRRDQGAPAAGTIVAVEGGPGYSSSDSRDFFLAIFDGLREERDLLVFDRRGTGASGAIDCPDFQAADDFHPEAIAACAAQLGDTANLYGTAIAVDDLAAALDALELGPIDYYGDSYGTYFGQVFAVRHPDRLRSAILDSAYPIIRQDPWYPTEWLTAWRGFDLVCDRSPACRALDGRSTDRLRALVEAARQDPATGTAPDGDGVMVEVTADPGALYMMMNAAGSPLTVYRETDAAARAWLQAGDSGPLLRLVAEILSYDAPGGQELEVFSAGLYLAAACVDYPAVFTATEPAARRAEIADVLKATAATRPDLLAPFTIAEVAQSPLNWERFDLCADWPAAPDHVVPGRPVAEDAPFPETPILVLSSDIDSITSPEEGLAAALSFPNSRYVLVRNLRHVVAWTEPLQTPADGGEPFYCIEQIMARFIRDLEPGDVGCATDMPPLRMVERFATRAEELAPVRALPGNEGTEADLRIVAAALETVGDLRGRRTVNSSGEGVGLRGGTFTTDWIEGATVYRLEGMRWTEDVAVDGELVWQDGTGEITATVTVLDEAGRTGTLEIAWPNMAHDPIARIEGDFDGRPIVAERAAP